MHPALLYFPGEKLSLPELCAARLDGHVVEVDEAYMPADTVEGPEARALALVGFVPADTAAMGPTAAWIHGAGDAPPHTHHAQRAVSRRLRVPMIARREFHDVPLDAEHCSSVGPLLVTTPVRTLFDLARMSPARPAFARWARALVNVSPELTTPAAAMLRERGRIPGKIRGLALLAELYDEVTRYTS